LGEGDEADHRVEGLRPAKIGDGELRFDGRLLLVVIDNEAQGQAAAFGQPQAIGGLAGVGQRACGDRGLDFGESRARTAPKEGFVRVRQRGLGRAQHDAGAVEAELREGLLVVDDVQNETEVAVERQCLVEPSRIEANERAQADVRFTRVGRLGQGCAICGGRFSSSEQRRDVVAAHTQGEVEWRVATFRAQRRGSAAGEQKHDDVGREVLADGVVEGGCPAGVGVVHVRAEREEDPHRLEPAVLERVEKGRFVVDDLFEVGAMAMQGRQQLGSAVDRRVDSRVGIRAAGEQMVENFGRAAANCKKHRSHASAVGQGGRGFYVDAGVDEKIEDCNRGLRRLVERRRIKRAGIVKQRAFSLPVDFVAHQAGMLAQKRGQRVPVERAQRLCRKLERVVRHVQSCAVVREIAASSLPGRKVGFVPAIRICQTSTLICLRAGTFCQPTTRPSLRCTWGMYFVRSASQAAASSSEAKCCWPSWTTPRVMPLLSSHGSPGAGK
jgi:hypothetical protein